MYRSKVPAVAKAVQKALIKSKGKDVSLYIKGNRYKAQDYEAEAPDWSRDSFCGNGALTIDFNCAEREIPTVEEIEERLIDLLFTVR